MAKNKAKMSAGKIAAMVLACIVGAGVIAGSAALIVKNKDKIITVDGNLNRTVIGFKGMTDESGELTWTGDIAKYNDKEAYETEESGSYVKVTSELDNVFPYNSIIEVQDKSGNEFVGFPKMYMAYEKNGFGYIDGVSFANYKVNDNYFISDAWLNPDGSGNYVEYFYMGKYEASGSASKIYSKVGETPLVEVTREGFRTAARSYGTTKNNYNGYQQLDIAIYTVYAFLTSCYYRTDNIETVYSGNTDTEAADVTGTTDGCNSLNGWNTSTHAVKMLGIENFYGSLGEWCDGIYFEKDRVFYISNPTKFSDTEGGLNIGFARPAESGWVEYLKTGTSEYTQSIIFVAVIGGSADTYEGDYYSYEEIGVVLEIGGYWGDTVKDGLYTLSANHPASGSYQGTGGRLCGRNLKDITRMNIA